MMRWDGRWWDDKLDESLIIDGEMVDGKLRCLDDTVSLVYFFIPHLFKINYNNNRDEEMVKPPHILSQSSSSTTNSSSHNQPSIDHDDEKEEEEEEEERLLWERWEMIIIYLHLITYHLMIYHLIYHLIDLLSYQLSMLGWMHIGGTLDNWGDGWW